MLLHDSRNDDGIKSFFQDVHELYIKIRACSGSSPIKKPMACSLLADMVSGHLQIFLNPLYLPGSRITSSHFDTKVRGLARKYL
ncbi:hypothetical protein CJ030_MR8G024577 [Morella rubra]|uniref:Uncharacterized protein n=1 Tax=Morella rubra TaxID=262757 RepID=A0A6A1URR2_9ROSI|nr:hypothetical protein CJ030_MR8G024577 [Morella rubra]